MKVVILGQDPYPNPGQYYGVCFSVPKGIAIPGSLANIFKEIHQDLGKPIPTSGNLDRWVAQGVFPMNSVLTVRATKRLAPEHGMGNLHRRCYQETE